MNKAKGKAYINDENIKNEVKGQMKKLPKEHDIMDQCRAFSDAIMNVGKRAAEIAISAED